MKLWHTVEMSELPAVMQNGLSNPCLNEITFSINAALVADSATSELGEEGGYAYAFLEIEIPDGELDDYFVYCMELHRLDIEEGMQEQLNEMVEEGAPQEDVDALTAQITAAEVALDSGSAKEVLETFGYACLIGPDVVITQDRIKVLDPVTMLEALNAAREADNPELLEKAIETTEARGLESLGATFWVWLLLFIQGLAQGRIVTPASIEAMAEQAEAKEVAKKAKRKKSRKKKRAKYKKAAAKSVEAGGEPA